MHIINWYNRPPTEEDVRKKIYEIVGAASMCWETVEGAGAFDSSRAIEVADEFMKFVKPIFNEVARSTSQV